jgi:hypothetical protein
VKRWSASLDMSSGRGSLGGERSRSLNKMLELLPSDLSRKKRQRR